MDTSMTLHHIPDTDAMPRVFHTLTEPGGHLCVAGLDSEDGETRRCPGFLLLARAAAR